ncbi:MAG TPA: class I SAM-dependent methyltransferase [Acidobacteriaceae bacterium]|nr:class I SAM-dependent methyltransferase [Acidobacteriaceae bacterium]
MRTAPELAAPVAVAEPQANGFRYVGSELDIFAEALNWKAYWSSHIECWIWGSVLEVGAGIGANTPFLTNSAVGRWVCLEPDQQLIDQLSENIGSSTNGVPHEVVCGTLDSLPYGESFDTILYIDVLEHIEDDAREVRLAAEHLRAGGHLIVLSPAHQWLFAPFDAEIGHFRRYNKASMRRLTPPELQLESLFYLDACGIAASAANQALLRQSMPTREQIRLWDRRIIPVSRLIDPVLAYSVGKSIVGVWRKK